MISSRKLEDLHPTVAALCTQHIATCKLHNIDLVITSTYRDLDAQNALYNQGRLTPGAIVTNAKAGQSFHNYRVAYDCVPITNGKCNWDAGSADWLLIVRIAKDLQLEWAGDWKTFKEQCHFQYTEGLTLKDFQRGKTLVWRHPDEQHI